MTTAGMGYELIDFGEGRKLERFGQHVLDRPCPSVEGVGKSDPRAWKRAMARYEREPEKGDGWVLEENCPQRGWAYERFEPFHLLMTLECLPSGQVGIFPEQAENWAWIHERVSSVASAANPLRVLNLFAYTGGSTIAAAAGGAHVTHVDAARSVVQRASRNASESGLADAPIRWIVEDAVRFCEREVRRGNRYHAIILDPPTYGHGRKGEVWQFKRDLPKLLSLCGTLTGASPTLILLTSHTMGVDAASLAGHLKDLVPSGESREIERGSMSLRARDGRKLVSGAFSRYPA